jgi:uncharacterized membrane-anchored protein YhcB (DUF1043 family)
MFLIIFTAQLLSNQQINELKLEKEKKIENELLDLRAKLDEKRERLLFHFVSFRSNYTDSCHCTTLNDCH